VPGVTGSSATRTLTTTSRQNANATPTEHFGILVLGVGSTLTLSAEATAATAGTNPSVVWDVSSGSNVASVSNNGVVTGRTAGDAVVRVRVATGPSNTFITHLITVRVINPGQISLASPITIGAAPTPATVTGFTSPGGSPTYLWSSSGAGAVTFAAPNAASTNVTGTTAGAVEVRSTVTYNTWSGVNLANAVLGQISRTATVTIQASIQTVTVSPSQPGAMIPGQSQVLSVTSTVPTNHTIEWSITDGQSVALRRGVPGVNSCTVDAQQAGDTTIRVSLRDNSGAEVAWTIVTVSVNWPTFDISVHLPEALTYGTPGALLLSTFTPGGVTSGYSISWRVEGDAEIIGDMLVALDVDSTSTATVFAQLEYNGTPFGNEYSKEIVIEPDS